jgi:hypothetical protein
VTIGVSIFPSSAADEVEVHDVVLQPMRLDAGKARILQHRATVEIDASLLPGARISSLARAMDGSMRSAPPGMALTQREQLLSEI